MLKPVCVLMPVIRDTQELLGLYMESVYGDAMYDLPKIFTLVKERYVCVSVCVCVPTCVYVSVCMCVCACLALISHHKQRVLHTLRAASSSVCVCLCVSCITGWTSTQVATVSPPVMPMTALHSPVKTHLGTYSYPMGTRCSQAHRQRRQRRGCR